MKLDVDARFHGALRSCCQKQVMRNLGGTTLEDSVVGDCGLMSCMHQANTGPHHVETRRDYCKMVDLRATSDLTYGGLGLRYIGSLGDRGSEVEMSIRVVESLNVRDIVTASLGLFDSKNVLYARESMYSPRGPTQCEIGLHHPGDLIAHLQQLRPLHCRIPLPAKLRTEEYRLACIQRQGPVFRQRHVQHCSVDRFPFHDPPVQYDVGQLR